MRLFFLIFPFISVWWCLIPIFANTCNFHFLQAFRCFLDLAVLFLLLFLFSYSSLSAWHIFQSKITFLYFESIYLMFVLLHTHMQMHAHLYAKHDETIITSDTVLRKIYLSLYLKGLCVRGSWRPNRTAAYWPPLLWPSAFLSRSPGLLNRRPGSPALCWVLFSLQHHFSNSLISKNSLNFLCTELYNSSTSTQSLMNFRHLWNGMFDRHRAEITAMQFTGHSLNPVPYCQPSSPTPMEYPLPASLEWHVWPGRRSVYYSISVPSSF